MNRFLLLSAPRFLARACFVYTLSLLALIGLVKSVALAEPPKVERNDLALIFSPEGKNRIFAAEVKAPATRALLPEFLIRQVEKSYLDTSVGDAVSRENKIADWMLVSARIVPCSPLGVIPGPATDILCWPEVRLIWQPVLKDFRRYTAILSWFADDRAIHSLHDVPASIALTQTESTRAELLLNKVKNALSIQPEGVSGIVSGDEMAEFVRLRNKVSQSLMQKAVSLRAGGYKNSDYSQLNERPEFRDSFTSEQLISKVRSFLIEAAPYEALKEMTSFSLPEGREPPQADEWVFLKYLKKEGKMVQVDITVNSALDGRELINLGKSPKASQMRDEPALHTALENLPESDAKELKDRVLLSPREVATKSLINDRALTLVPNTTCGSCHKFNNLRFDFHNLSFLEDRQITISPRVKIDVTRDLEWLSRHLSFPAP